MKTFIKWLAIVATAGMFVVLVMGATVTNTGSEHGCGRSWPLCHGKLIPQFAVSTFIEFSHRAVVGVESCFIIGLAALTLHLYRRRRESQFLAPLMAAFLFLQAGLGAWAVMYPQLSAVLALHFGVSLVAFASVLLTAVFILEADGADAVRDIPLSRSLRRSIWALTGYSYLVVYLGAFVRHIDADQACSGWPLCNGTIVPALTRGVEANVTHRAAAGLLLLAILALTAWTRRLRRQRPDMYRASLAVLALAILQALSGAAVVFTRLDLFAALSHAALVGLMFGGLTYLCMHTFPRPAILDQTVSPSLLSVPAADPDLVGAQH